MDRISWQHRYLNGLPAAGAKIRTSSVFPEFTEMCIFTQFRIFMHMIFRLMFSTLPYTPHEIENAMHPYELPQIHYTVVRVAKAQMGIGGDDSWGAYTHPEYLLNADRKMEFSFSFKGI